MGVVGVWGFFFPGYMLEVFGGAFCIGDGVRVVKMCG